MKGGRNGQHHQAGGQPCLVMQHNSGGMCRVDRLLVTAGADSVATMLDLLRSIDETALATALSAAASSIDVSIVAKMTRRNGYPQLGTRQKFWVLPLTIEN